MKKFIISFICVCTLLSIFALSAAAQSDTPPENDAYITEGYQQGAIAEEERLTGTDNADNNSQFKESEPSEELPDEDPLPEAPNENEGQNGEQVENDDGAQREENFFEVIYREIEIHSEKIFSVLAFIGSLIIALAYKKGLLPLIRGALTNMKEEVERLGDTARSSREIAEGSLTAAAERLDSVAELFGELNLKIAQLEEELKKTEEEKAESAKMHTVIAAQVDMLYEIFMSSSLPVYQKDMVGERISRMKEELKTTVKCDEEG